MVFKYSPESYNPQWPQDFNKEAEQVLLKASEFIVRLEHIGSTSIQDLTAKPIIDIIVETNLNQLSFLISPLIQLGYESKGEYGISGRSYFSKPGFHIHAFEKDHPEIIKHIAFRDYLRAHSHVMKEYNDLKLSILKIPDMNRDKYQALKQDFLRRTSLDATAWYTKQK